MEQSKSELIFKTMTNTYTIKKAAEILNLGYGNVTLYKKLRNLGILDCNNSPYIDFRPLNYFKALEKYREYSSKSDTVLLVTHEGLQFLKKLKDENQI